MVVSKTPLNTVQGLSSGIQWKDIIDAMIGADRASTAKMEQRKGVFQGRLDAVRSLNTKLLSLSLDLSSLNRTSSFQARQATSSNDAAVSATATNTAIPGSFTFDVVSVATAGQVSTSSQASNSTQFGAGSLTITQGTGSPTVLTIDAGNSTLDGIATTINNTVGLGVSASVVNSGSGATPYKLLLTSKSTGVSQAISTSGTGGLNGLFSAMTTVTPATDAQLRIGSGGGAILLTQASNTFANVTNGVTVTAKTAANGVQVSVGTDTKGARSKIDAFITSFNGVIDEQRLKAGYDPTTKLAGPLFSESDIRRDLQKVTSSLIGSVPGLPTSLSTLTSIGISIDRSTGKLSEDGAVLDGKLAADPDGVMRLFTNSGTSSSTGVSFSSLTTTTKVTNPFIVDITTPAEQAVITGTAMAAPVIIDNTNNALNLTIGTNTYNLTLAAGTYTADELAAHVQAVINNAVSNSGEKVDVKNSGGALAINSRTYGYAASLRLEGTSTALTALGLGAQLARGTDVSGFINGVAGSGSGQVLSGAVGTAGEGLRLNITATTAITGVSLTARKGLAQSASESVRFMTDSTNGSMANKDKGFTTIISSIADQVTKSDERLAQRRQRYTNMFLAMEKSINASNSLGSYIQSQVKGFENSASAASK